MITKKTEKKVSPTKKESKQKAVKFDDLMTNCEAGASSFEFKGKTIAVKAPNLVSVPTSEGDKLFHRGDYLLVSASGDLMPCHHDEYKE